MPRYFYKAKNLKGEEESGVLIAQDPSHLAKILRKKGYFLISIEKGDEKKERKFEASLLNFLEKFLGVPLTEKLFFTRNLEVMIRTGVPLPKAFQILSEQTRTKKFQKTLKEISERIIKGESLSGAISAFPEIFPRLYQETLKVGEETGKLEDALKILSIQMEREHNLRSRIKTAMVYPTMVLCMTFVIGIFMMIFAVPKLKTAFEELNVKLPFTTRLILSFADFLTKRWPIAILIAAGLIFISVTVLRSKKTGRFKSALLLKIPVISKIVKQTNSALTLRTLSSLLAAGVPIVRSLEVASGALTNFYFKESLVKAAKVVEKGGRLSEALRPYQALYSPMVLQMMEVGEETGETAEVLEKLADFYEQEVTSATQKLSATIEPILIMIVGGIVGFFAISMMQPMFSIMGGIR
jgi:type II secretory pathway component PulF